MVTLDFSEDELIWVASKLLVTAESLGAEAIELINWLVCFRCSSEELRVVIANLSGWMA